MQSPHWVAERHGSTGVALHEVESHAYPKAQVAPRGPEEVPS